MGCVETSRAVHNLVERFVEVAVLKPLDEIRGFPVVAVLAILKLDPRRVHMHFLDGSQVLVRNQPIVVSLNKRKTSKVGATSKAQKAQSF